jgi:2-methylisocitrate lyase-like PEP mutase family enzyme
MTTQPVHPAERFRQQLQEDRMLEAVGVYDALTARLVEQAGFDVVILGAGATTNFLYGMPDIGLLSLPEVIENVERVAQAVRLPVIADLDNVGGSPMQVRRHVQLAERAGAAILMVEDIDITGKHLWSDEAGGWDFSTDKVLDLADAVALIRGASRARSDDRTVILARTDAYPGGGLDDAIERAQHYAAAGADVVMFAHMPYQALTKDIVSAVPVPIVHIEIETPSLDDRKALADMGVKLLGYALQPLLASYHAFRSSLEDVKEGRTFNVWEANRHLLETCGLKEWSQLSKSIEE